MKLSIKHAVTAALAIGGLASSVTALAVDNPNTGNGALVLFVTNTATNEVYVRDIGLTLNSLITEGTGAGQTNDPAFGAVNTVNYSLPSLGADSTLNAFLGTGPTSAFTWNLIGGDSLGSNSATTPRRFALTTTADLTVTSPPSNSLLGTLGTAESGFFDTVTTALGGNNSVVTTIGQAAGQINVPLLNTFFNQAPQNSVGALDSSMNFFVITSSTGGGASPGRVFAFNDLKLDAAGLLSAASVSEVPVPAAVWLFGSGLLGMMGVGRRRKAAGQVTA